MADELPKTREIPKPQPIIPFPGLPPTDCMGECCDQHYTIRQATQLVKAGRKIERSAMKTALQKRIREEKGKHNAALENYLTLMMDDLDAGELTGVKL